MLYLLRNVTQYITNIAIFYIKKFLYIYKRENKKTKQKNLFKNQLPNTIIPITRTTRLSFKERKMTICAIQANILSTTLYKSNLEFSIMSISNKRQQIAYQTMQLSNADWETDPRVKQLQAMDSYLELQQKNLETQQKSAASQLESYQKILDTNVKKDFTLNLNA